MHVRSDDTILGRFTRSTAINSGRNMCGAPFGGTVGLVKANTRTPDILWAPDSERFCIIGIWNKLEILIDTEREWLLDVILWGSRLTGRRTDYPQIAPQFLLDKEVLKKACWQLDLITNNEKLDVLQACLSNETGEKIGIRSARGSSGHEEGKNSNRLHDYLRSQQRNHHDKEFRAD